MRQRDFYLFIVFFILTVFLAGVIFFSPEQFADYLPFFNEKFISLLPNKDFYLSKDAIFSDLKVHDVYITADGFQPKSLTVAFGDAVRWINTDAILHWPASDPHPTHTGVIGFDAESGLASGEIYVHIFDNYGIYTYHDHLQALTDPKSTITGVIKVQ